MLLEISAIMDIIALQELNSLYPVLWEPIMIVKEREISQNVCLVLLGTCVRALL